MPNSKRPAALISHTEAVRRNLDEAPDRVCKALDPADPDHDDMENEKIIADQLLKVMSMVSGVGESQLRTNFVGMLKNKRSGLAEELRTLLQAARYVTAEADDRVIGTSATAAFPGQPCDVLVRHVM